MTLVQKYQTEIKPKLMEEYGITNPMATPKIVKVVLNIGLKEAIADKGVLEKAKSQLTEISGQLPKITRAKKSIANFKLREGDAVGLTATLRGVRMYDFLTKLFNLVLPRVRDFQGVSLKAFDAAGNYTLGLSEQIVFPEIDYAKIDKIRGLEITVVVNNANPEKSKRMLELMGMPFKKS